MAPGVGVVAAVAATARAAAATAVCCCSLPYIHFHVDLQPYIHGGDLPFTTSSARLCVCV